MPFQLFKKAKKEQIALDIGSQKTKALHISKESGRPVIDRALIRPTPEGSFASGEIAQAEPLAEFLTKCVGEWEWESEINVIAGISGKGLVTKQINIPKIQESLIAEHLPFEAEQYLPYDLDDMDLDYEILKGINTESDDSIPILLVAALQETVKSYNSLFEKAFISCETLDANVFALFNCFERNYKMDSSKVYLLADIGFKNTNIVAVLKNQVVFTRNIAAGGELYTREIQKRLGINRAEAEELKISAGKGEAPAQDILSIIQETHAALCDEIFSAYEIYLSFFASFNISKAYVTGGGSLIPGVVSALSERFSVPVETMSPFESIGLSADLEDQKEALEPFLAVAAGLGLRGL